MAALIFLANVRLGFNDQARETCAIRSKLYKALTQQCSANFEGGAIEIASGESRGTTQPAQVGIEDPERPYAQVPRARLRPGDIPVSFVHD